MSDVVVIGDKDSIIGFKSIGFDIHEIGDEIKSDESKASIIGVLRKNYKIVYLIEQFYKQWKSDIDDFLIGKLYPVVVPIPSVKGKENIAVDSLKLLVERALGGKFFDS